MSRRSSRALALISPLLFGCALRSDDWPMYGGRPDRNMVSAERGLPTTWSLKSGVKWVADAGNPMFGSPSVAGGRIFIGTDNEKPRIPTVKGSKGILLCLSAQDGSFLWQAVHDRLPKESYEDVQVLGIGSTPCVAGDHVFYVSNRGELVSREVTDGKAVWSLDMRKDLGVTVNQASVSSPLVVGDLVFVVTGQGRDINTNIVKNPKAPSFIAVDRGTGKLVWQDNSPGDKILTGSWGSPAYGVVDGQLQVVFPGGDGWLYAFEPSKGTLLWKFNCKVHEKPPPPGLRPPDTHLVATPVFVEHRVLVSIGIAPSDGYDSEPGCLRAIDARMRGDVTGSAELWRYEGEGNFGVTISSVAVHEGLVYASDLMGYLNCLDLDTGKIVWKYDSLSSAWGGPLVADGKIYWQIGDGEVLVLQPGREKKLLARNREIPDVCNGTPVAANGVLYVTGQRKLYAISSGK